MTIHLNIVGIIHPDLYISNNEAQVIAKLVCLRFQNSQDIECVLIIPHIVIKQELCKVFVNGLQFEAVDAPEKDSNRYQPV